MSLNAQKIKFLGRFVIEKGNMDKAVIHITKNGNPVRTISPQGQKFEFDCEANAEYIFSFEKPDYITKRISINTFVAEDRLAEGFEPFKFNVYLFPQLEGVNTVVFNQPVGKIMYKQDLDDIGYDSDYTKSIEAQMKEFDLQYKAKEQEVLAQPPSQPPTTSPSNPIQPSMTSDQQVVPSALPTDKKQSSQLKTAASAAEITPDQEMNAKNTLNPSLDKEYKNYSTGSEDAERRKAILAGEDQLRRNRELAAMSEDEKRRNRIAASIEEMKRNQYPKPALPAYSRSINIIKEPRREIFEVVFSTDGSSLVFRKVTCSFGGEFYFKNNVSISKWIFETAVSAKSGN